MIKIFPPFPSLKGRLYFFPALFPAMEIVPWLLTAVGALAGMVGMAKVSAGWRKIATAISLCAVLAIVVYYFFPATSKILRTQQTEIVTPAHMPATKAVQEISIVPPVTFSDKFSDLWSVQIEANIFSMPVISEGLIIVGTYKNNVLYTSEGLHEAEVSTLSALSMPNGNAIWQREFLGHIESSPLRIGNQLLISTGPSGVWSLDVEQGHVQWHREIGLADFTPMVIGNTAYIAAQADEKKYESIFYALDVKSGTTLWQTPLQGQPWGWPILDKSGAHLLMTTGIGQIGITRATDAGWAEAISPIDGKVLWQTPLPGMPVEKGSYLPSADLIFYTLKTGDLIALHAADGTTAWKAHIDTEFEAEPSLSTAQAKPLVAAISFDGIFSIRDARTGHELVQRKLPEGATAAPVFVSDTVYVATPKQIFAFGGLSGL
jgi:outer membrane protein assembly factor BamB